MKNTGFKNKRRTPLKRTPFINRGGFRHTFFGSGKEIEINIVSAPLFPDQRIEFTGMNQITHFKLAGFRRMKSKQAVYDIDNLPPINRGIDVTPLQTSKTTRRATKRPKSRKVNVIPLKLRAELSSDPQYGICSLRDYEPLAGPCGGKITWEHALIYAGRRIQARFAIIPMCECHHAVNMFQDAGTMNKELNHWIALNRATVPELITYSKAVNLIHRREYLNDKYGVWVEQSLPKHTS